MPTSTPAFAPTVPPLSERVARASRAVSPMAFAPSPAAASRAPVSAPTKLTQPQTQRSGTRPNPDGGIGKGNGTVIVLFRGDLRVHDHAALTHALEEGERIVPVYVFDTRQFGSSPAGFQKTGSYRARFLLESVQELRSALESRGGGLVVRVGLPERIVPALAKQIRASRVFVHKEIALEEQHVERALREALPDAGSALERFWSNTLYYEDDLPFPIDTMPDVYTDFRVAVQEKAAVREPLPAPERVPGLPKGLDMGKIPTLTELGIPEPGISRTSRASALAPATDNGVGLLRGGEKEALLRLRKFAAERSCAAGEYEGELAGASVNTPDFACRISPWLAIGCLSPRLIFDEMKRTSKMPHRIKQSYTYYELVWRDFFRCITAKYSNKRANAGVSATAPAAAI